MVSLISSQGQRPHQTNIPSITTNDAIVNIADAIHCTDLHGMSVLSTATGKTASLGGILVSNNRYFGLTVRHSFLESNTPTSRDVVGSPPASCDNNHEFAFDSDEEEELGEVDMSDAAITSQGG